VHVAAFTAARRGAVPDIRYLGIELNPTMADPLVARFPGIDLVRGQASCLPHVLAKRGLAAADLVVSGIPWQAFAGSDGTDLVAAIAANLAPSGAYTQFTYSWTRWAPPGRRQHRELQRFFGRVELSPPAWGKPAPGRRLHRERASPGGRRRAGRHPMSTWMGEVLDLYDRIWDGRPLGADEYVLSADEKTQLQALHRRDGISRRRPAGIAARSSSTAAAAPWPT
jgi:hypothetical protein